jgi:16S rRNA A1518/A1519 N6-dimethyltransferase RsmA/KsgA/DIM1 with predicted DNA glycosylase/AP lyase activity
MVSILKERISTNDFHLDNTHIKINHIDVLKYMPTFEKYDVIANIPYYITSPILRHFLYETAIKPVHMIILMQDDV